MIFNDIAVVSVKINDYRNCFWYMSHGEAINVLQNSDLRKNEEHFERKFPFIACEK